MTPIGQFLFAAFAGNVVAAPFLGPQGSSPSGTLATPSPGDDGAVAIGGQPLSIQHNSTRSTAALHPPPQSVSSTHLHPSRPGAPSGASTTPPIPTFTPTSEPGGPVTTLPPPLPPIPSSSLSYNPGGPMQPISSPSVGGSGASRANQLAQPLSSNTPFSAIPPQFVKSVELRAADRAEGDDYSVVNPDLVDRSVQYNAEHIKAGDSHLQKPSTSTNTHRLMPPGAPLLVRSQQTSKAGSDDKALAVPSAYSSSHKSLLVEPPKMMHTAIVRRTDL